MEQEQSLGELAERTGEPVACLEEWRAAGLVLADGRFEPADAERARLVRFLLRRGFSLETIVQAERLLDDFLDLEFAEGQFPTYTLTEAAEKTGVDSSLVRRLWEAIGLNQHGDVASDDDIATLAGLEIVLSTGLPEAALIELVRVYADALRRVAEAEVRLFHFHVHERLRAAGVSPDEVKRGTDAASAQLRGLVEPAVLYFHRKGWAKAVRDDLALHVAEEAGLSDVSEVPGTLSVAIVFSDLARFTPLTEVMGDAVAADIVDRFSKIVRNAVAGWDGRIVKQIGDGHMLVFFEPGAAVACALEVEARAAGESQFPAVRSGAHWGPVLYREGDYLGATVNLASRLETEAGPHQLLVTAELRRAAEGLPNVEFVPLGRRTLKGVSEGVEVFDARPGTAAVREKLVDPVCGMELNSSEVAASLDVAGEARAFCSTDCLQRFVAAPERYSP
ncbi:MAG: adenylate cyclase regulatory domain-containing protein [Acidimicrobiia bacterium]